MPSFTILIIINYNSSQSITVVDSLHSFLDYECLLLWLTWFSFTNRPLLRTKDDWLHSDWLLFYKWLTYKSESESYITIDGQSVSLSRNKAPVWGLRPDLYYLQTVADLLMWRMWSALSDERTGLSFTIAPGPRQRSHFRVRVPCDSWPYFTVSESRLPFPSPPTTRRVTVEVFDLLLPSRINYVTTFYTSVRTEYRTLPSIVHVIPCLSVAA
jgi:hypothetical protein